MVPTYILYLYFNDVADKGYSVIVDDGNVFYIIGLHCVINLTARFMSMVCGTLAPHAVLIFLLSDVSLCHCNG